MPSLQSSPTLCDLMNHSLPGSSVHGILQERVLELVAMPSSKRSSNPGIEPQVSCQIIYCQATREACFIPCARYKNQYQDGRGVWGRMDTCICNAWVPSLFTWNYHNIVDQLYKIKSLMFGKKKSILGLPGGWVVRTLSFHFKGYGFNPGSGN